MRSFLSFRLTVNPKFVFLHATCLICVFLACMPALAQEPPTSNGPYAGYVQGLAADSSGRVYAATFLGGIFRTSDNGDNWEDLYEDTLIVDARAVAIGPGGVIYAGLDPGFMRSTDDGATWQRSSGFINSRLISSICLLPNGHILVATVSFGVYRSTDGGITFNESNDSLTNTSVWSVAATPSGDTVYAGTYGGGVFRSIDGGTTWFAMNSGLTQTFVTWVGVAPDRSVFACAGATIFRSTDHGGNWSNLGLPSAGYGGVAVTPGAWYAAGTIGPFSGGGVYSSTDDGATWNPDPGLPNHYYSSLLHANNMVFAGSPGYGVFRRPASTGTQGAWVQAVNGMTNTLITSLAFDTAGVLFAGTRHSGVYRSADSGASWVNLSDNVLAGEWINDIAVNPLTNTLLATGVYRSYRSTDGGDTWQFGLLGQADRAGANGHGSMFATFGNHVYRSTDDGLTWPGATLPGIGIIQDIAFKDSTVYVATGTANSFGTSHGVWRSTDDGLTWASFNSGLTDSNIVRVLVVDTSAAAKRAAGDGTSAGGTGGGTDCERTLFGATWSGDLHALENGTWIPTGDEFIPKVRIRGFYDTEAARAYYMFGERGQLRERDDLSCEWIDRVQLRLPVEVNAVVVLKGPGEVLYGTFGGGVINVRTTTVGVDDEGGLPRRFALHQNYPNPFNPGTTVLFDVPTAGHLRISVFDLLGREAAVLVDRFETPGRRSVEWDAGASPGGVYFIRMQAGEHHEVRKTILLK